MSWQRVKIALPSDLTHEQRERFGERAIETIIERTNDGYGVQPGDNGVGSRYRFPRYTSDYSRKTGKSRGAVNLRLTSEMLDAIEVLSHKRGQVLIGFENGSEQNDKAEGNQTGSYGQPDPNPSKARRFLGLTDREYDAILEEIRSDSASAETDAIRDASEEILKERVRIRG